VRHNFYLSPGASFKLRATLERLPVGEKSEPPELAQPVPAPPTGTYRMPATPPRMAVAPPPVRPAEVIGFGTLDIFAQRELMPWRNDVSHRGRPRRHRAPRFGARIHTAWCSCSESRRVVAMHVRNQNSGGTEQPDTAQPVFTAIDQHSAFVVSNHDGGMPSVETRPYRNVSASSRGTSGARRHAALVLPLSTRCFAVRSYALPSSVYQAST
jgi:hypothetical protein